MNNIKNVKVPPQIFFYGVMLIIIVWIVFLLLKRVGLIKDAVTKKLEKDVENAVSEISNTNIFDPNLYKQSNYGYAHLPSNETVNAWVKGIKDSFGWFNDDEERIYSIFRQMNNKLTVSQVSDAYTQLYRSDLFGDLRDYLNDRELAFLWKIIDSKPKAS
jgi:hypothetical protein